MTSMTPHLHTAIANAKPDPAFGVLPESITERAGRLDRQSAEGVVIPVPRANDLLILIDQPDSCQEAMCTTGYSSTPDAPAFTQIYTLFRDRRWVPVVERTAAQDGIYIAVLEVAEEHPAHLKNHTRFLATLFLPASSSKAKTVLHLAAPGAAPFWRVRGDEAVLGWTDAPDALPAPSEVTPLNDDVMDAHLNHISSAAVDAFAIIDADLERLLPLRRITEDPILRSLDSLRREAGWRHEEREASSRNMVNAQYETAPRAKRITPNAEH